MLLEEQAVGQEGQLGNNNRALTAMCKRFAGAFLRWEPIGCLSIEFPDGEVFCYGAQGSDEAYVRINNYRVVTKTLLRGPIGFAEAYIDGDVDCPDLTAFFRFIARNRDHVSVKTKSLFGGHIFQRFVHRARRNSKKGSRRNISAHYDLGNAFFQSWLDSDLNYSSGIFSVHDTTLEAAQRVKLDMIVDALDLTNGEKILEIGCGWGALARTAATRHNAHVTGITLSSEQLAHARKTVNDLDFDGRCRFELTDYRDVCGEFDRIMSVEMIEAVGEQYWPSFFQHVHNRLKPGGIAVIQAITIDESRFDAYRKNPDFIQRYVFPGGMLPTPTILAEQTKAAGLQFEEIKRFGDSYALTLREWRHRFEAAWPKIVQLGFDDRFRRMWRYYLTYCEAAFMEGAIDVGIYRLRKS